MNSFGKKIIKTLSAVLLSVLLTLIAVAGVYDFAIPDRISYFEGGELPVFLQAEAAVSVSDAEISSAEYKLFDLLPVKTVELVSYKETKLIPGGMPFGVKFFTDGAVVSGFCDLLADGKEVNPAKEAGLRSGDVIRSVDGIETKGADALCDAIDRSGGKELTLTYIREGVTKSAKLTPIFSEADQKFKAGIMVRDSGAGIGTVSFIEPESGLFAGLGHGICDVESGALVPIRRGAVMEVSISGIEKGLSGDPGEIKGFFKQNKLGSMIKNTECGVFGVYSDSSAFQAAKAIPIGLKSELKPGEATIYCTLDEGGVKEYRVSISNIDRNAEGGKCFSVKVTDPALLEKTGGIVQGMSGSPIIQNGKLVGAVTHVLINDPTTGYGIFIENMLAAANSQLQPKAA